ncbi:MAG: flagellar motor protein [Gammaproteobacteria bacterium]|nr:flagellar motor protein [Gammaproteobacteria bacterium]
MDILSLIGALIAIIALFLGQTLDGGSFSSLINAPALLIVVGGSLGAIMVQVPVELFVRATVMFRWVFFPPTIDLNKSINRIVTWSEIARREGILGLDKATQNETDIFSRKAVQLLVDGRDPSIIRSTLEVEIETEEEFDFAAAKIYESMGGYTPTLGILGAVMGLIHVMENLSDPGNLGAGIATAFVATIYGVGLANLFLIPVSKKLKRIVMNKSREKEMIMEGLICIAQGENPRNIFVRLQAYNRRS